MPAGIRNAITIVFLFILLLTAVAAVFANLGLWGLDPNSLFAKTTLGAVLVEIVSALILVWKTGVLHPRTVSAAILFSDHTNSAHVDLDPNGCTYEVRDMRAKIKSTGKLSVVLGHTGWECKFPSPKSLDDSITLKLSERGGTVWEVRPFYPLSREVKAVQLHS
jgi:hypothetical protein